MIGEETTITNVNVARDLNAEIKIAKLIVGEEVRMPFKDGINYLGYSINEGRLVCVEPQRILENEEFADYIYVSPLFNTKALPQFYSLQFRHPIVPLVD